MEPKKIVFEEIRSISSRLERFTRTINLNAKKKEENKEMTFTHAVAAEVVKRLVLTTSASARGTEEDCFLRNKKH